MPHLLEAVQLAVLVGQRDDDVLEPLRPARVRLARAERGKRGRNVRVALDVAHDLRAAPEQRVVLEPRLLDRVDELGPDLVVALLILGLRSRPDLKGEAQSFHRGRSLSTRNRYRYRMLA